MPVLILSKRKPILKPILNRLKPQLFLGVFFISNKNSAHAFFPALGASEFAVLGCIVHLLDEALAPLGSMTGPLGLQEEAKSLLGPYRLLTSRGMQSPLNSLQKHLAH